MARYWSDGYKETETVGQAATYGVTVADKERWDNKQDKLHFDESARLGSDNLLTSGVIAVEFDKLKKYAQEEGGKNVYIDILVDSATGNYGYKTDNYAKVLEHFEKGKPLVVRLLDTNEYAYLQSVTQGCFKFVLSGKSTSDAFHMFYLYSNDVIVHNVTTLPKLHAWALSETKPAYTYSDVGAEQEGVARTLVQAHNTSDVTHADIRALITGLTTRLNALLDSDDTTLNQLSEIVAYIKSNRTIIEEVTDKKVNVADIIDNLSTADASRPLSAQQGFILNARIDEEVRALRELIDALDAGDIDLSGYVPRLLDTWCVYTTDGAGAVKGVKFANTAVGNSIPQRDANGNICVGNPTDATHSVPKSYVDGTFIPFLDPPVNALLGFVGGEKGKVEYIRYSNYYPFSNMFLKLAPETEGDTIQGDGYVITNTPTRQYHAANKKYVDETLPTKLSELENDEGFGKEHVIIDGSAPLKYAEIKQLIDANVPVYFKYGGYGNILMSLWVSNAHFIQFIGYSTIGGVQQQITHTIKPDDTTSVERFFFASADAVPTKLSQLNNDCGYITEDALGNRMFTIVYGAASGYYPLRQYESQGYTLSVLKDGHTAPLTGYVASRTEKPYPAHLYNHRHVTVSDFVGIEGNQMADGEYVGTVDGVLHKYYLPGAEDFNNTLVSIKVKWMEGTYKNRIDIGGSEEWKGFSIQPNEDGSELTIHDNYGMVTNGHNAIAMTSAVAKVDSFIGNELLLQLAFKYSANTDGTSDLQLSVYINGVLYNGQHFTIAAVTDKGSYMNVYSQLDDVAVTLSSIDVYEWCDKYIFALPLKDTDGQFKIREFVCGRSAWNGAGYWSEDEVIIPRTPVTHQLLQDYSTDYKSVPLSAGGTFNLREKGLYILCGYDYDLDLYDPAGVRTGEKNCLVIIVFCTEADANGNFSIFAMQNYKGTLGVSSIKSVLLSGYNENAYVKNTGSNGATVFYMRQKEV